MVLIMELLGPGISDSIEIKARYYGMHWDIVGDNDGIYDKMADMFMGISCDPKICFSGQRWAQWKTLGILVILVSSTSPRMLIASGGCICRSTDVGGAGRGTRVWLLSRVGTWWFPPPPMSEEDHRTIGF